MPVTAINESFFKPWTPGPRGMAERDPRGLDGSSPGGADTANEPLQATTGAAVGHPERLLTGTRPQRPTVMSGPGHGAFLPSSCAGSPRQTETVVRARVSGRLQAHIRSSHARAAVARRYARPVTPREALLKYFDALNRGDLDAAMTMIHLEYVELYPQSGERVRGRQNLRAIIENYPGGVGSTMDEPTYHGRDEEWAIAQNFTVVRVADAGNSGTAVIKVRYGDGSDWWMIALFEIRDDMIHRQATYFAQPFDAPEWRAKWVERDS